jgi:hypothetical protein
MTTTTIDAKSIKFQSGEFAASPVLSDAERQATVERQWAEGWMAAALGRTVGTHEPEAVQAGAWAFECEIKENMRIAVQ